MAGLKKSEKRLLIFFGVILFVVANLIGEGIFARRKTEAAAAITKHKQDIATFEYLLKTKPRWDKRRDWVEVRQPRYEGEESAATDVENFFRFHANATGVSIDASKPTEPLMENDIVQVGFDVNASGSPDQVTEFVSLLQDRDAFFALPNVSFASDRKDPSILRVQLRVVRWYSQLPVPSAESAAPTGIAGTPEGGSANQN